MDSYAWGAHLSESRWYRFFELDEFKEALQGYPKVQLPKRRSRGLVHQQRAIQLDMSQSGEYGKENLYRRFPRAPLESEAIVHNQKKYSRAICIDISEKGVFLKLEEPDLFEKGEEVMVTIRNAPVIGTISAHSVIIRVKKTGSGLYFLRMNPQVRRRIAQYVLKMLEGFKEQEAA